MKKLIFIFATMVVLPAFAGDYERPRKPPQKPTSTATAKAGAIGVGLGIGIGKGGHGGEGGYAKAYGGDARQGQGQGQQQGQGQKQGQGQGQKQGQINAQGQLNKQGQANSQGQESSNNGVSIVETHDYQEIPVATAWAPPTQVTAPCVIGASAGGQVADYGISFGGGFVDGECVLNRDIALFKSMGASDELLHQVMCQKDSYRTASANIPGLECPEYEGEDQTALRPIRDKMFGATSLKALAAKARKCHIADEGCY